MGTGIRILWIIAPALALAGCDSQSVTAGDRGVDRPRIDAPRADLSPDLHDLRFDVRADLKQDRVRLDVTPKFDGGGSLEDLVFDRILVPTTQADAMKYALQYNGKSYNAAGQVLALVSQQVTGLSIQDSMDLGVSGGFILELLRVQAASFTSGPAQVTMWRGQAQSCCSSADVATCKAQAKLTCFNGSHTFAPDALSTPSQATGSIGGGQLSVGPAALKLDLVLTAPLTLTLDNGQLKGTLGSASITDGVIAGGIPLQQVSTVLIPALASALDLVLKDPLTSAATKATLTTLFDTNKDGSITAAELATNGLISTVLAGDLDLDGDKKADHLSIGLGFTAVGAAITP